MIGEEKEANSKDYCICTKKVPRELIFVAFAHHKYDLKMRQSWVQGSYEPWSNEGKTLLHWKK